MHGASIGGEKLFAATGFGPDQGGKIGLAVGFRIGNGIFKLGAFADERLKRVVFLFL
jgi:hypothetical protein